VREDELLRDAFDNAVHEFAPDHIVIVVRASNRRIWQRQEVLDHLAVHHRLPVTIFAID
jgi:hypothetical protein